ncbi:ketopantoate reductase family protein [Pseudonocardia sp. GCM10023141]|uniref:ketopantoate reductase family protein n=1 Tax=Pseudonocardia sp. GCM10023141 TaxID=3252653 RepID=UPI00361BAB4A
MRYVVIGAGAIGGTIGVRLARAGRSVVLVARGAHLEAIRSDGLRLDEPGGSHTVRLPAVAAVGDLDWADGDVALLCTKTQDTPPLLEALSAVAPSVPVVCVQNGVANERLAAERFADVLGVCVMMPAEHLTPGRVASFSAGVPGLLDIGRYPSGVDALTEEIADDLTAAGFSARPTASIMRWKYSKLLGNLGNAAEAACGFDDPDLPALYRAARDEGTRCLDAAGIDVASPDEDRERRGTLLDVQPIDGAARQGGSTWQSLQRGIGSVEVAYLNGEIVALGERHGVPTPVNTLLLATAERMAAAREAPGRYRAADLLAAAGSRTAQGSA